MSSSLTPPQPEGWGIGTLSCVAMLSRIFSNRSWENLTHALSGLGIGSSLVLYPAVRADLKVGPYEEGDLSSTVGTGLQACPATSPSKSHLLLFVADHV